MDLYCNEKTKTGHRTPGVSKWRGRFALLSVLVTLLLVEGRILLATFATRARCWLVFTLQPSLGSLSPELLHRVGPRLYFGPGLVHPDANLWLFLLSLKKLLSTPFSSLLTHLRALQCNELSPHFRCTFTESSLCHITCVAKVSSVPY